MSSTDVRTIGIVAHSAEGAALCFLTACHAGEERLGAHHHPPIVMSALPMGPTLPQWERGEHDRVALHLAAGIEQVARAGADFFVCPDNTAHLALERIADALPIPGLHIAEVVAREIERRGLRHAALVGTEWTMTGPVYERVLREHGIKRSIPDETTRVQLQTAIFDELCRGIFRPETTQVFLDAIDHLKRKGADCAILGCTEIPLIVNDGNAGLPTLDSTRLLARAAVDRALDSTSLPKTGWI